MHGKNEELKNNNIFKKFKPSNFNLKVRDELEFGSPGIGESGYD